MSECLSAVRVITLAHVTVFAAALDRAPSFRGCIYICVCAIGMVAGKATPRDQL